MDDHGEDTGGLDDEEVVIHVPVEVQAGVWANWARISESDHAFDESGASSVEHSIAGQAREENAFAGPRVAHRLAGRRRRAEPEGSEPRPGVALDAQAASTLARMRRAAGLVVVAMLGVALSGCGDDSAGEAAPEVTVGSDLTVTTIEVGPESNGVSVSDDAIWVSNEIGEVRRVDPATNQVTDTVAVSELGAGDVVYADGVWVGGQDVRLQGGRGGPSVWRVDPDTLEVTDTIQVDGLTGDMAASGDAVWVIDSTNGLLLRIDTSTRALTDTVDGLGDLVGVAAAEDAVWAITRDGNLTKLDPDSGSVLDGVELGTETGGVAASAGAVWATNRAEGTVLRLDPDSLEVTDTVEVGELPAAISASDDAVWVVNEETVARIDPTELTVTDVVEPDSGTYRVATQGDSAWITAGLDDGPLLRIG